MNEKRLFQTLDEMNVADGNNNTGNVGICNFLVSANKVNQGGHVTMGVPESVVLDLVLNPEKKMCLLLVIEKEEYEKVSASPSGEEWIRVEDLPKERYAVCLVFNGNDEEYKKHIIIAPYFEQNKKFTTEKDYVVTHWRYLPSPPITGDKVNNENKINNL